MKTIAEIIGKTDYWHCSACECDREEVEPTVDELLTWLDAKTGRDYVFGPDDGEGYFMFALWDPTVSQMSLDGEPRGWEHGVRHMLTMLETVEAIVRLVDADFGGGSTDE